MMMTGQMKVLAVVAALIPGLAAAQSNAPAEGLWVSGPHTHERLSVYLVHGPDMTGGADYLTLDEAMAQKKVVVHETGTVAELSIENVSDQPVFVQSGDIVKGGKQDRVLRVDTVVPPKSGKVPIASFCVEQGRWQQRKGESVQKFSGSDAVLAGKSLKMAVRGAKDQGEVWRQVANTQSELTTATGADVRDGNSATSLQLTLENKTVGKAIEAYVRGLKDAPGPRTDVVGFAFAIDGNLSSADVYGSPQLFRKLWGRNLKSAATEAVAAARSPKKGTATASKVQSLVRASAGKAKTHKVTDKIQLVEGETGEAFYYDTQDKATGGYIRRNILTK